MIIDLSGKKAVVSGSTAGIGFAIAKGLAASGAEVVINGRTDASVERALTALRQSDPAVRVAGFAGDLSTPQMCERLLVEHPSCDILVNSLGIFAVQDFFDIDDAEWERFFQVNVMSGVRLARGYVRGMAEKGWGRVVFISSESALNIPPAMIHYGFTKTAQLSISRGLAKRMAGTGVTVNSVLPGPTLSDGFAAAFQAAASRQNKSLEEVATEFVQRDRSSSIIRRAASVEEVANMVVYVCSKEASATTGAALRVDGGVVDTIS
jgi:NAD(P)-dependent dehydrogenase (short-subunit alcohol dehydrogenase family)